MNSQNIRKGFHGIDFWTSLKFLFFFLHKIRLYHRALYSGSKIALCWLGLAGFWKTNGSWLWLFLVIYSRVAISYFAFFSGLVKMARDFLEDLPWDERPIATISSHNAMTIKLAILVVVQVKTFNENWNSKRHLLELSWPIQRLRPNFHHLFEKEFCETSQSFNLIRQWIGKMEIKIVWMS